MVTGLYTRIRQVSFLYAMLLQQSQGSQEYCNRVWNMEDDLNRLLESKMARTKCGADAGLDSSFWPVARPTSLKLDNVNGCSFEVMTYSLAIPANV